MREVIIKRISNLSPDTDTLLTDGDREYIESLTAKRRKEEVRAWRGALREKLREIGATKASQAEIKYDQVGAPYITEDELFFSISHSSTHIAIIVSDTPCAIDIESIERDFKRAATRYATARELALESKIESSTTPLLPLLWSAKETLYKLSKMEGLDLLKDLIISNIDPNTNTLCGSITPHTATITMRYAIVDRHIVVYTSNHGAEMNKHGS